MDVNQRFRISYGVCRWLLVPVVALHNAEEWITEPRYGSIAPVLQAHATGLVAPPSLRVLQIGWVIVTLAPALIVWLAVSAGRSRFWDGWVCWVTSLYLANAVAPHLVEWAMSRSYAPGILTATFVNLPFTLILLWRARVERCLPGRQLAAVVAAGFVSQPIVLAMVHAIASELVSW